MTNKKAIFLLIALTATMSSFDAIARDLNHCEKLGVCILDKLKTNTDISKDNHLKAILLCPKEIKEIASELNGNSTSTCILNIPISNNKFTEFKPGNSHYVEINVKHVLENSNQGYILFTDGNIQDPCNKEPTTKLYGGEYVTYWFEKTKLSNEKDRMENLDSVFSASLRRSTDDNKIIAAYSPQVSPATGKFCPFYRLYTNGASFDDMTKASKYRYSDFYIQAVYHTSLLKALVFFHNLTTNIEQTNQCPGITFRLFKHDSSDYDLIRAKNVTESHTKYYDKDGIGSGNYDINLLVIPDTISDSCTNKLDDQVLEYTIQ